MNIASFLGPVARINAERPAVSVGDRVHHRYADLAARVAALAGVMRGLLALPQGARVAIAMKNRPEYIEIQLACWHAGLCIVPMNAKLHPREFAQIIGDSGAALCFVDDELCEAIVGLQTSAPGLAHVINVTGRDYQGFAAAIAMPLVEVLPDDPAWIFYTSGTTGSPKGATLSHRNLLGMSLRYFADIDALSGDDCYIHAGPMSHGGGLYGLPHLMKAAHIVVPASHGFDVDEMFGLMRRYSNISFFVAPTMLTRMTSHKDASTSRVTALKTIIYGGAPLHVPDLKRALSIFGPCFYQCFGQGESPMTGIGLSKSFYADADHPQFEARLASTGLARTGVEVRIVDGNDRELPQGEIGEILFRSDVTMLGYWNNPEATAGTLRGGWLHTGDIGFVDSDGFVTLKDRSKDLIISGGSNIYPREVEEVLLMDARIVEVSVVGFADADWGEKVVAFVVARQDMTILPQELDMLCLDNIARFKRPKHYVFLEQLPKSGYGKVLKTELRRWPLSEDVRQPVGGASTICEHSVGSSNGGLK